MKRIPEPELMVDPEQTAAYAGADFAAGHQAIVDALSLRFPDLAQQNLGLDLGCGPLDVTLRILERFPKMTIHGVDGSGPMLDLARAELERHSLQERVILFEQCVPELELPEAGYPLIFSSSFCIISMIRMLFGRSLSGLVSREPGSLSRICSAPKAASKRWPWWSNLRLMSPRFSSWTSFIRSWPRFLPMKL